ncbi:MULTISPECIES: hypothetical protein [Amycolatopsis]|uniref:Uncharacterized protein n=2 Tax=Amycolatopsis TaxID=1813 RepID=A0A1I3YJP0_9PSEU|nr:hypothetical protein [Amycolatopsis sacchari]SFK31559.1 hypothetical protein SAMN05421835_11813 [Amycolatopsis sacchari]
MVQDGIRVRFRVAGDAGGQVCFEPTGMCYDLADGEHVSALLDEAQVRALEVTYWAGGISVWVRGNFTTFDQNGNELHQLWGG